MPTTLMWLFSAKQSTHSLLADAEEAMEDWSSDSAVCAKVSPRFFESRLSLLIVSRSGSMPALMKLVPHPAVRRLIV